MSPGVLLPGFSGLTLPDWMRDRLVGGLAGVCLYGENVRDGAQLRALIAEIRAAAPDAIVAIDEEGGDVTRLHYAEGSPYPGNAILGRLDDLELTAAVGAAVAAELAGAGATLNLAPVADVNANPLNPVIGVRSFGAEPALVARHTAAWVAAHQAVGVATSVKHFPGHGDVAVDSHHGLPVLDARAELIRERDLAPFRAAIAAGAATVMTSHIVVPAFDAPAPATFSAPILQGLLRGELGFRGVIVSDALDMKGASGEIGIPAAAVRALAAGVDLLLIGVGTTEAQLDELEAAIAAAIASGELAPARLLEAEARVAALAESGSSSRPADRDRGAPIVAGRLASAFDVRAEPPAGATLVQLETERNMAIGAAPWGLAAAGVAVESRGEGEALPAGPLVLVGKDNHRHAWVRAAIDAARATRPVLAVDMGWPSEDRRYADVATFGASRAVGSALAAWLGAGA